MNFLVLVFAAIGLTISETSCAEDHNQSCSLSEETSLVQVFSHLARDVSPIGKGSQNGSTALRVRPGSKAHRRGKKSNQPAARSSILASLNASSVGVVEVADADHRQRVSALQAIRHWLQKRSKLRQAQSGEPESGRPSGGDIWNSSKDWITIQVWHPAGVISNINNGRVLWADVSYVDLETLMLVSTVAYPAFFLFLLYMVVIIVSSCLGQRSDLDPQRLESRCYLPGVDDDDIYFSDEGIKRQTSSCSSQSHEEGRERRTMLMTADEESKMKGSYPIVLTNTGKGPSIEKLPFGLDYAPPILSRDELTPFSQTLYSMWVYFCCTIPSLMVFGLPIVLIFFTMSWPQEIYAILSLLVAALIFSNGIAMVIFATSATLKMREAVRTSKTSSRWQLPPGPEYLRWLWPCEAAEQQPMIEPSALSAVHHWVIMPQYNEEFEIVSDALRSISKSAIARTNISILLAMEEREVNGKQKADRLRADFKDLFEHVCISYHPANLPNDPAGKASNLKWASDCLLQHLWGNTNADLARIIVTVSDADSDFHNAYFETLSTHYLEAPPEARNLRIWQSSIAHIKNYYNQPAPVIVGTMFTTMQELCLLGDPNGVRFPYSTYSLSLELVRRVGGWDAEWIAEDWHMGIKCYLLTFGNVSVEPIFLPIINYTPEDSTWWTKCVARWAQAKRHALGFSDMSYYFMMLPLIFAHALSRTSNDSKRSIAHMRAFWGMFMHGVCVLIRLVNVHVCIGVMATYGLLNGVLRLVMLINIAPDRNIDQIWERTEFCVVAIFTCTAVFMAIVTVIFHVLFTATKHRIDPIPEETGPWKRWIYENAFVHWVWTGLCFLFFGPFYFLFLGLATWRAAIKMIVSPVFEYEVASKSKNPASNEQTPGLVN